MYKSVSNKNLIYCNFESNFATVRKVKNWSQVVGGLWNFKEEMR